MTTKELDERINEHLNATSTSRNPTATASATAASTTVATETLALTGCPLTFWKAIVHVTTTRTNGNIKIDQDNVCISFALIKQKPTESVADYKRRFSNILDSYAIVSVPLPAQWIQAIRFMQGLDAQRFGTMNRYFANELTNGRGNYPTTLDNAVNKATRWQTEPASTASYTAPISTFIAEKQKPKKQPFKPATTSSDTCTFCRKIGHTQEMCHQFKARQKDAQEATKNQKPRSKGKVANFAELDISEADDDTPSALLVYHLEQISLTSQKIPSNDLILDTGDNGSIVNNRDIMTDMIKGAVTTFKGLSGTLSTTETGSLGDLCTAF
jgi:hypothetical protein